MDRSSLVRAEYGLSLSFAGGFLVAVGPERLFMIKKVLFHICWAEIDM